jgi:hypothetical protein
MECGTCDVVTPTIDEQLEYLERNVPVMLIPKVKKALGHRYDEEPNEDELRHRLRRDMDDVVKRFRANCNQHECLGTCDWHIAIDSGVVYVRFSVIDEGWQP